MNDAERVTVAFYSAVWISTEGVYLQRYLVDIWMVPRETAAISEENCEKSVNV